MKTKQMYDAVNNVALRSEKCHFGGSGFIDTYVNDGHFLERVRTSVNQYVIGRRGTGKTHLFRCANELINQCSDEDARDEISVYVDLRGCSEDDLGEGCVHKATVVVREFCFELIKRLKDFFIEYKLYGLYGVSDSLDSYEKMRRSKTEELLCRMFELVNFGVERVELIKGKESRNEQDKSNVSFGVSSERDKLVSFSAGFERSMASDVVVNVDMKYVFPYRDFLGVLEDLIELHQFRRMFIFIDEWSSIDVLDQPYVADYFKRIFLSSSNVFIKIAVLPIAFKLSLGVNGRVVGLETDGDIFQAVDLDNDLVYQRNPSKSRNVLKRILFNHVRVSYESVGVDEWCWDSVDAFFESIILEPVHDRMLKFSHGNPRDYLILFRDSYVAFYDSDRRVIMAKFVDDSAKSLGDRKCSDLSVDASRFHGYVIRRVLFEEHRGVFLVRRDMLGYDYFVELVHHRLLHIYDPNYLTKGESDAFCVVAVDYCSIVTHLKSPGFRHVFKAPEQLDFFRVGDDVNWVDKMLELQAVDRREAKGFVLELKVDEIALPNMDGFRWDSDVVKEDVVSNEMIRCAKCGSYFDSKHQVFVRHSICVSCGESIV